MVFHQKHRLNAARRQRETVEVILNLESRFVPSADSAVVIFSRPDVHESAFLAEADRRNINCWV